MPVRKITRTSFRWIGSESVTSSPFPFRKTVGTSVLGPATPEWKTLGAVGSTCKLKLLLLPPGVRRIIATFPTVSNGICALIWLGETNRIGTGSPFTVRQLSASAVGSGISAVARLTGLKLEPNTVIRPPGAIPLERSAALTIFAIAGGATEASYIQGSTVKPDTVRLMMAVRL